MTVVATGVALWSAGWMAPEGPDIDLLFLLPYKQTARGEQIAEAILYCLWDMGPEGFVTPRALSTNASASRAHDMTIRTVRAGSPLPRRRTHICSTNLVTRSTRTWCKAPRREFVAAN